MKVFINDMLTSAKNSFVYNFEPENLSCDREDRLVKFNSNPSIVCNVSKKEDDLCAVCNIHLDTTISCVRCLEDMSVQEDIEISGKISKIDDNFDEDLIFIDHDYLDLEKIIYDAVFEHLGNNLYCKDDCKGLCINCATNLNHKKCSCDDEYLNIDPRLEQLKTFLE